MSKFKGTSHVVRQSVDSRGKTYLNSYVVHSPAKIDSKTRDLQNTKIYRQNYVIGETWWQMIKGASFWIRRISSNGHEHAFWSTHRSSSRQASIEISFHSYWLTDIIFIAGDYGLPSHTCRIEEYMVHGRWREVVAMAKTRFSHWILGLSLALFSSQHNLEWYTVDGGARTSYVCVVCIVNCKIMIITISTNSNSITMPSLYNLPPASHLEYVFSFIT